MQRESLVDIADRHSRKRAVAFAIVAVAFLAVHVGLRQFYYASTREVRDWWAINVVVALALIATGGGLINPEEIRLLVNDDVARANRTTALAVGFWVAMAAALVVYAVPMSRVQTPRETIYVVVTASLAAALFAFAYLEFRAHADA